MAVMHVHGNFHGHSNLKKNSEKFKGQEPKSHIQIVNVWCGHWHCVSPCTLGFHWRHSLQSFSSCYAAALQVPCHTLIGGGTPVPGFPSPPSSVLWSPPHLGKGLQLKTKYMLHMLSIPDSISRQKRVIHVPGELLPVSIGNPEQDEPVICRTQPFM